MTSTQPTPSDKSTPLQSADCTLKGLVAFTKELQTQVGQLRNALDQEREHVRVLQRQKQDEVKRVRHEEQQKASLQIGELRARLQQEKLSELQRQKETLTRNFESEFQRLLHRSEEEARQARAEVRRVREELTAQVRDAERRAAARSVEAAEPDVRRLAQEVADLRGTKRHLEEELNAAREKERRLANELRRSREKQESSLIRWQKDEESVVRRLVRELKAKDRMIGQLEYKLNNPQASSGTPRTGSRSQQAEPNTTNYQRSRTPSVEAVSDHAASRTQKTEPKKHAKKRKLSTNMSPEAGESVSPDQPDLNLKAIKKGLGKVSPAMYKRLYAEHLQLQRSFALLRHLVAEEQVNNGTSKISSWAKEKLLLESAVKEFRQKVDELSEELRDTHEQNELLEFRVLELEQCQGKGAFSKSFRECAINTEPCDVTPCPPSGNEIQNLSNFEFLVKQFPITDPKEEHVNDIKNSLKTIFYYPGIPTKQKQELARTAAHLESCHIVMNRIRNTITELVAKAQTLEQEKKTLVSKLPAPSEANERFEQCQKELDKTRHRLSEVEEELGILSERQKQREHELNEKNNRLLELEKIIGSSKTYLKNQDNQAKAENEISQVVLLLGDNEQNIKDDFKSGNDEKVVQNERTEDNYRKNCVSCQNLAAKVSQYEGLNKELGERLKESEKTEQELTEKNLRLYIDYVSAKEQIQRLLLEIAANKQEMESGKVRLFEKDGFTDDAMRETPDSFNVIPSEDEGLGDESRRGDSTGPSSLVDMQESDEDLLTKSSELDSDILEDSGYDMTPSLGSDVSTSGGESPQILGKLPSLPHDLSKTDAILHRKQITSSSKKLADERQQTCQQSADDPGLRQELKALKEMFEKTKQERDAFHEQVLELEEAENDARRECQRLQGQMDMLLDRGEELQMHLVSAKKQLDLTNRRTKVVETNCDDLSSQVHYMETVIEQYKNRVEFLESSESTLKEKLVELSSDGPKSLEVNEFDFNREYRTTSSERSDDEPASDSAVFSQPPNAVVCVERRLQKAAEAELVYIEEEGGFDLQEGDVQIQVDMSSEGSEDETEKACMAIMNEEPKPIATTCSTQTEPELSDRCPLCITPTNSEDGLGARHRCAIFPPWEKVPPPSMQVDLMERLSALEQDDCNLQEQLHKMDEMNLALWQKLHHLETRVGLCKKAMTLPLQCPNTAGGASTCESSSSELPAQPIDKHRSATARLDDLLLEVPIASHSCLSLPTSSQSEENKEVSVSVTSKTSAGQDYNRIILERIINLENSEHKLKERLLQLEYINQEFEKELEMREKLYREKEARNRDWTDIESELHRLIQNLEKERSTLLAKVGVLEQEKKHLEREVELQNGQLSVLKARHAKEIEAMQKQQKECVLGIDSEIVCLEKKGKQHLDRLSQLEQEKESLTMTKTKRDSVKLAPERDGRDTDEKYVAISQELEAVKDAYNDIKQQILTEKEMMFKMKDHFEEQLRDLLNVHCKKEKKLEEEISLLLSKEREYCKQIAKLHDKEVMLLSELKSKEKELEDMKSQHTERMKLLEEEHRVIEAELRWKLKEVEENTTLTVKALQDEKTQVEMQLQADLKDLQNKEGSYKARITELESRISELRNEINDLTNSAAKSEKSSKFTREDVARLLEELKEMHGREQSLKQALDEMEKRESAYQETLQNADIIVSSLQRSYQEKIDELEMSEKQLKLRIAYLEGVEARLRSFLKNEKGTDETRRSRELIEELIEADTRENTLRDRICVLEVNEKGLTQKVREMEKRQKQLELELQEHDELVTTIDSLQRQREEMAKEMAKLHRSEQMLREMLIQSEALLNHKEEEAREKIQSIVEDNRSREETINQMRIHIKELNEQLASCQADSSKMDETSNEESIALSIREQTKESEMLAEKDEVEREFRAEVSHLRHSLSSTNAQLLEMDIVRRCQETELNNVKEQNASLQQQIKCLEEMISANQALQKETSKEIPDEKASKETEVTKNGCTKEGQQNQSTKSTCDDISDACLDLEECVKRAMFAMEMEIQQKETSPENSDSSLSPSSSESSHSFSSFWPVNKLSAESTSMCVLLHDFSTTSFPQTSRDVRREVQLAAGQRVAVVGSTLPDGNCVIQLNDTNVLVPAKILREIGAPTQ